MVRVEAVAVMTVTQDRIILRNYPVIGCIQWTYDVKEYQIAGPDSLSEIRNQHEAAAPAARQAMRTMLRTPLVERFGLVLHHESRELGVYALVPAKGGIKLRESDPDSEPGREEFRPGVKVAFRAQPISELADFLSTLLVVGRPVIDGIGIGRRYSFTLDLNEALRQPEGGRQFQPYYKNSLACVWNLERVRLRPW